LSTEHLVYFILLSLFAEILGTVGGFGSSIFFVPLAGLFLDFHSVLGITALFHVSSNISKIALFKNGFNKKIILSIGIPAVIFTVLGGILSKYFDNKILEICLAILLIGMSALFLIRKNLILKPTFFNSVTGGATSGLAAGMVGTGGALRGLTLAAFNLNTEVFIATSAIIDLGIDASRSAVYFFNDYIHFHDLYLIAILFVVSVVGTYIGKKTLHLFTGVQFKKFVLVLILLIGLSTLITQIITP
jgi:uncharacterized protein